MKSVHSIEFQEEPDTKAREEQEAVGELVTLSSVFHH